MAELSARNISYAFSDGTELFANISLHLRQSEFVALLGDNGSGKSTLLALLAGFLRPLEGSIEIAGIPAARRGDALAIVLQNPDAQLLAPTVEEELALALELRGRAGQEIRNRVEEYLRRFDLLALRQRSPEALSGGQKQRVAVASLMIAEPMFLLLDEPDSYLDAPSRNELMEAVNRIRGNVGILWTCSEAERLPAADRYLRLTSQAIEQIAPQSLATELS